MTTVENNIEDWDIVLESKRSPFSLNLREIIRYRDLLAMFIKKDIITVYKQTILGPIWFLVQPIMTTLIYTLIFGNVAKISSDGIPRVLFYSGSVTLWNYFSDIIGLTSKTFTDNASVFGKVYFPRIILPLSKVASGVIKFLIQFCLFTIFWLYFVIKGEVHPNLYALLLPLIVLRIAVLSLGLGIIITSLTTKYRDLTFLVGFGVQLLMYATPVIYPISLISKDKQTWLWLNPLTSLFEAFKYGFLGKGVINYFWLGYSVMFTTLLLFAGLYIFNRVEKKFIDTV